MVTVESFFQVSWLRGRDTSVLSVGHLTFSSSERFRVVSNANTALGYVDWNLEVSYEQGILMPLFTSHVSVHF